MNSNTLTIPALLSKNQSKISKNQENFNNIEKHLGATSKVAYNEKKQSEMTKK